VVGTRLVFPLHVATAVVSLQGFKPSEEQNGVAPLHSPSAKTATPLHS
jgi:hypothetical protein